MLLLYLSGEIYVFIANAYHCYSYEYKLSYRLKIDITFVSASSSRCRQLKSYRLSKNLRKPVQKPILQPQKPKTAEIATTPVADGDTIKVGILHSLSGTMAISETSLKDTALMTIDEINANGGVLGKQLDPIVVDPASDWPLFAEKARQLLTQDKVDVIFGGWTSVSRKSVLPVVEELNGLMFYPVQYEGQEQSENNLLHWCCT